MIKQYFLGKIVEIIDKKNRIWNGKVSTIISALDSDSGENEITIEFADGLIEFRESEIKNISLN
jgi:hypothetical protein